MTPRLKRLFIAVIVIQVVFLLGLVGYRESILIGGRTAVLKTVPVDPRDLFKGEYVTLRYEISTIDRSPNTAIGKRHRLQGGFSEGDTVYVGLHLPGADQFEVQFAQTGKPANNADLFIKGRVISKVGETITVEYGIEQYFIPEGRGLEIEQADDVKVRVKINRSGTAAIETLIVDGEDWRP
jgi:uncharacterized membrane-anchored protein